MTGVQVSDTRRIGFTALALVSFWVMAWHAYWTGADYNLSFAIEWLMMWQRVGVEAEWFYCNVWVFLFSFAVICAVLPTVFLSLSIRNSVLCLGTRIVLWSALLMTACSGFICWLGNSDAVVNGERLTGAGQNPTISQLRDTHQVSWPWLLLPIILTTAFVIFGAWRRAVRDAEVEAVVEGE